MTCSRVTTNTALYTSDVATNECTVEGTKFAECIPQQVINFIHQSDHFLVTLPRPDVSNVPEIHL